MQFFKTRFALFLRSRHALQHFRRRFLLESLDTHGHAPPVPQTLSQALRQASDNDEAMVLAQAGSHLGGLTEAEVSAIRARVGSNEVEHEKPLPAWLHLWHCYQNPFNLLLTALAIISWLTDDAKATVVIGSMVLKRY